MRKYNLNIAGYNIGFEVPEGEPDLISGERFLRYITKDQRHVVLIRIHSGKFDLPEKAERIFHAPYVEEINGIQIQHRPDFWSVWKSNSNLFIRTIFPLSHEMKSAVLRFSLDSQEWDLWINGSRNQIDPFEYPLDGLVLYYLTVIHSDIMIHASGVNNLGHGYLFSGISGKGKSTMAKLWENCGAKIIHDDRLIIRNTSKGYRMYNTPVYKNDEPRDSPLDKIFILEHGDENKLTTVKGADAVSLVMANCIQHNWGTEIITGLLGSISAMCGMIPVVRLSFKPDNEVIENILENEQTGQH